MEDFIAIKLFLARHPLPLISYTLSGTNSQESTEPVTPATRLHVSYRQRQKWYSPHRCRVVRNLTHSAYTILASQTTSSRFEGAPTKIFIRAICTGFAIVILTLTTNLTARAGEGSIAVSFVHQVLAE